MGSPLAVLWAEARNTAAGARALLRALRRLPPVPRLSLSVFETDAADIRRGVETRYRIVVSLADRAPRWVTIGIDAHEAADPTERGRIVRLSKLVLLPGRGAHAVELHLDWRGHARFVYGDLELAPDHVDRGDAAAAGDCYVSAALATAEGRAVERLVLRQRIVA